MAYKNLSRIWHMKIRLKQNRKAILELLKTSNIKRKLKILEKLNGVNERESIKILLKILEDTSWTLREKAANRLVHYGNRVVPRLEKLLARGFWYTRASACLTLGEIGNFRALEPIIQLYLTDDNPTVIKEASGALVKLGKRDPLQFAEKLEEMELTDFQQQRILQIIADFDPETHTTIMEELAHE
jgi:HEAT repeat protein